MMGGDKKRLRSMPLAGGWTGTRDLMAPTGKTFRELYKAQRGTR
jgi:hypothetical protein